MQMSERSAMRSWRPARGFTLMELMIVVVVISILALVAVNSYQASVRKSRRADVQGVLLDRVQALERYYTNSNTYLDYLDGAGALDDGRVSTYYGITYGTAGNATTATTYVLVATPKGTQAKDPCGTLTINQIGTKTASGTGSNCWQ
jgi:type IV pilus assembly protein PilE